MKSFPKVDQQTRGESHEAIETTEMVQKAYLTS